MAGVVSNVTQSLLNVTDVGVNVTTGEEIPQGESLIEAIARIKASFQYKTAMALYQVLPELTYAFGFAGNMLAFVVILRMRPFTNASLFLSALAVSDFFYLLTNCVTRFLFDFPEPVFKFFCYTLEFFLYLGINTSLGLVMALCVERSLAVWKPFEVARLVTRTRCIVFLIVLCLVSLGLSLPLLFSYEPQYRGSGVWFCTVRTTTRTFILETWKSLELFLTCVFPATVFTISTVVIVVGMKKSTRLQQLMTSDDIQLQQKAKQSRQVTIMLVSVIVVFIFTYFPYGIFAVAVSVRPHEWGTDKHMWIILFNTIFNILKDMNSALNCYCYFFTARRFRAGVFDLLTFGGRIKVKCLRNDSDKVKSMATDSSGVSRSNTGLQPSA